MTDNNHIPNLIARTRNDEDSEDDEDDSNYNTDDNSEYYEAVEEADGLNTNDNSEYYEAAEEANGLEFDEQGKHAAGARAEQGEPGRARAIANWAQATADRVGSTDRAHHAATEQYPVHQHNLRGRRARDFGHLKTVG